ncbi:hypothetical protein AK812_SmicGene20449 [Symbiodinium microadriaticum]|uniref:Uncharacterized protein n=1 Tax=Symbiodinium microadriaticum TaxID=2951 RepID=A0A1Q9DPV1_SYMMI|nr:hypothetical protein AK812_SmicGene20449 [Symbiodinium microadriaticum]
MVQEQSRCRGSALVFFLASSVLDAAELHGARRTTCGRPDSPCASRDLLQRLLPLLLVLVMPPAEEGSKLFCRAAAGRREALLGLAGAAATLSSQPAEAFEGAGQWMGYYADPQHPMCPRKIVYEYDLYDKAQMMVDGGDGNPGCEKKVLSRWTAKVDWKAGSDEITIDFSKKGGPAGVVGKWDTDGIVFPDGNKWKKIISYNTGNGQGCFKQFDPHLVIRMVETTFLAPNLYPAREALPLRRRLAGGSHALMALGVHDDSERRLSRSFAVLIMVSWLVQLVVMNDGHASAEARQSMRKSRPVAAAVAAALGACYLTTAFAACRAAAGRREALLGLAGAAATLSSQPAEAFEGAGQWMGYYADPQHPMCPRKIVYEYDLYDKAQMMVDGGDGNPGCEKKVLSRWTAKVDWKAGSDEITIDFSKKGGPAGVVGKWDTDGIVFPDGNKWKKIISYNTGNGQGCFKQFDPHLVIRMVETTFLAPNLYPAREALPLRFLSASSAAFAWCKPSSAACPSMVAP